MKSVLYLNLQASHVSDLFDDIINLSRKIKPTVGSIKESSVRAKEVIARDIVNKTDSAYWHVKYP